MQNKQNYTVSNLVAKYTNTPNADKKNVDLPLGREQNIGEELLAHLYNDVAGDQKNAEVWSYIQQYDQDFNEDALTKDEYDFLKHNFAETVESVISAYGCLNIYEVGTLPTSALEFAVKYMDIKEGEHVYVPNAGYGDVVMLLRKQKVSGYINGSHAWALAMIRFFAAGIDANIECLNWYANKPGNTPKFPEVGSIDVVISVINGIHISSDLCYPLQYSEISNCLSPKGRAFLFSDTWTLTGRTNDILFRESNAIIQFPHILTNVDRDLFGGLCSIYIQKDRTNDVVRLIDLSSTSCERNEDHFFDMSLEKALEIVTNAKEHVKDVKKKDMDPDIYVPTYYFVNRPKIGVSISSVMSIVDTTVADVDDNLPVITSDSLSDDFMHSAIDVESLPNVKKVKYPYFRDKFYVVTEPCILLSVNPMAIQCGYLRDVPANGIAVSSGIIMLKPSTGLSLERATLLLQIENVKEQLKTLSWGLHGEKAHVYFDKVKVHRFAPYVTYDDYDGDLQFNDYPCDSFQANDYPEAHCDDSYHCEVLSDVTPEQMINALQFESDEKREHFLKEFFQQENDIHNNLVQSFDKLNSEIKKLHKDYENKINDARSSYINEVRMRKHDMRPHLRQIASTERLLLHYLKNINNIDELRNVISTQVSRIHDAVSHLSDLVEHLTDDDKFGTPERFNLDKYFNDLQDGEYYTIDYDCDDESLIEAGLDCHRFHKDWPNLQNEFYKDGKFDIDAFRQYSIQDDVINIDTYISSIDFDRLVQNIIENAKRHGFTDPSRNDYNMYIYLSIDKERGMYQIDFRNNGNPLPEGMNKERYGIKGERGGKTGGTGQGGHIVKTIVEHYGGDYDIFSDEGVTNIRIYLPILR